MKRILLCSLFGIGLLFGMIGKLSAAVVADADATNATDTVEIIEPSGAELRIDSLLELLDQRLSGLEQEVQQLRDRQPAPQEPGMRSGYLTAILIVLTGCSAIVTSIFFALRFRYRSRKERYDRDRFAIERGCYPAIQENPEQPQIRFIRRLLVLGIVCFCILAWIGIANLNYMRFFPALLLWILLGGVGYAVFHLFRQYVKRCDENR